MTITLKEKALNFNNPFVVALDGSSASGKGTIGKLLAQQFHLTYFQSSILYRGLAKISIDQKIVPEDFIKITELSADHKLIKYLLENASVWDLNDEYIGSIASKIATIPSVRENLNHYQINLIRDTNRIIMEGRDIASFIAPNADLKIFLKADVNARAKRRYKQLQEEGKHCIFSEILEQLKIRDLRDQERAVAPLVIVKDALVIDNTDLEIEQVITRIMEFIMR